MVRILGFDCCDTGLIPGLGTEILTRCMVQLKKKFYSHYHI